MAGTESVHEGREENELEQRDADGEERRGGRDVVCTRAELDE